jgi:hypothetical protein
MPMPRGLAFVVKEVKEIIPPTIFFAISFNLIVLTFQLVLDEYGARFASFAVATATALVVAKAVLVANAMPFFRRFDGVPLIRPILFKSTVYFVAVLLVRFLERLIEYLLDHGTIGGIPEYVSHHFLWHRFVAVQIWILVLFLIYTTASEVNGQFRDDKIAHLIFGGHRTRGSRVSAGS